MNDNLQNLTLTAKEFEAQRKAFAMAVLLAVAALLFFRRDELDQLRLADIARMASSALLAVTVLFWAFYKWCWRSAVRPSMASGSAACRRTLAAPPAKRRSWCRSLS
jgi:Zn-dependent protease